MGVGDGHVAVAKRIVRIDGVVVVQRITLSDFTAFSIYLYDRVGDLLITSGEPGQVFPDSGPGIVNAGTNLLRPLEISAEHRIVGYTVLANLRYQLQGDALGPDAVHVIRVVPENTGSEVHLRRLRVLRGVRHCGLGVSVIGIGGLIVSSIRGIYLSFRRAVNDLHTAFVLGQILPSVRPGMRVVGFRIVGSHHHRSAIHRGAIGRKLHGGGSADFALPNLLHGVAGGLGLMGHLHVQLGVGQEAIVQTETIPSRSIISSPLQAEIMFAGSIQIISIVVLRCISNFQPIAIKLPAICINRYILGCVLPLLLIPLYCIGRSQDDLTPVCNRICGRTNGSIIIFVIDALPIQLNRNLFRPLAVLIVGVVPEQMEGQLLALQGVQAVVAQVDVHVVIVALGGGGDVVGRAGHAGPVLTDLSRVVRKLPAGPVVRHVIGTFHRLSGGGDEMHIGPGGSADQVASGRLHIRAHLHAVGELERLGGLIIVVHGPAALRLGDEHIVGHQLRGNVHLHLPHAVRKLADSDAQVGQFLLVAHIAEGHHTAAGQICGAVRGVQLSSILLVCR